ncbi:MAG: hypothetical protein Q9159_000275 [Coniocarpon cinnabarinum]
MDAVGVSIELAKLSVLVAGKIKQLKSAPDSIAKIRSELDLKHHLLRQVIDVANADFTLETNLDDDPWIEAIQDRRIDDVRMMLQECPSRINDTNSDGNNSLMLVFERIGFDPEPIRMQPDVANELCELLFAWGADPDAVSDCGWSYHRSTVDQMLLSDKSRIQFPPPRHVTRSQICSGMPHVHRIVLKDLELSLVEHLSCHPQAIRDRDDDERTALWWAAATNDIESVRILLLAGADVNAHDRDGETGLYRAIGQGNDAVVNTLLDHHADTKLSSIYGVTCLGIMTRLNHSETRLRLLDQSLKSGVNPKYGYMGRLNVLQEWIVSGDATEDEIDALLEAGVDVEDGGVSGWTALACSVYYCRPSTVHALLMRSANRNVVVQALGWNVFHFVAHFPHLEMLQVLRDHGLAGVDPEAEDYWGRKPADLFEQSSQNTSWAHPGLKVAFYDLLDTVSSNNRIQETQSDTSSDDEDDFMSACGSIRSAGSDPDEETS